MSVAVRISDSLGEKAKKHSKIMHRSIGSQIEYWAEIGEILESNPELSFNFVQEIMLSRIEVENNELTPYEFNQ